MSVPTQTTSSVTVSQTINASPARLYAAFTSRDEINNWFCNNSFVQAQENGHYLFIWTPENYSATGQFKELVENEKLVLTWRSTWEGNESDYAEKLTITFEGDDDETTVTFHHEGMPEDGTAAYDAQWTQRLNDLQLYVETGGLPNIMNRVIIGIYPGTLDEETAEAVGLESGVYARVTNLVPDLGAEKAGIQIGDIITHMNGQKVSSNLNMNQAVAGKKAGDEVEVTLVRDGETMTLSMPLSAYPTPDLPENHAGLADRVEAQYDDLMKQISDLFDTSEVATSTAPAEGEWSAKMTLAHLIYSERRIPEDTGGRITGRQPQHWSGNDDTRLSALIEAHPTNAEMIESLRRAQQETLAMWRNFPAEADAANAHHLWGDTFGIQGWIQHSYSHLPQIQAAIEAAQD